MAWRASGGYYVAAGATANLRRARHDHGEHRRLLEPLQRRGAVREESACARSSTSVAATASIYSISKRLDPVEFAAVDRLVGRDLRAVQGNESGRGDRSHPSKWRRSRGAGSGRGRPPWGPAWSTRSEASTTPSDAREPRPGSPSARGSSSSPTARGGADDEDLTRSTVQGPGPLALFDGPARARTAPTRLDRHLGQRWRAIPCGR